MKRRKTTVTLVMISILLGMLSVDMRVTAAEKHDYVTAQKRIHYVQEGEYLCSIAEDVYGDAGFWSVIYETNRELIGENPDYLKAGLYLELPEVPGEGITWSNLFLEERISEEVLALDSYQKEGLPYQIEEHYILKGEEVYCYPQFVSLYGRDMSKINEVFKGYAGVGYQITYLDENLLSLVIECYMEEDTATSDTRGRICKTVNINIKTGDVYTGEELFTNKQQLPKGSSVFVDKAEVKIITGQKDGDKASLSKAKYEVVSLTKEELLQNQTDSPMWDKWNSDDKEAIQRRMILWSQGKAFYLEDINHPDSLYELGRSIKPDITQNVCFSPNGKYIYYHHSQSDGALYRIEIAALSKDVPMKQEQMVQIVSNAKRYELIGRGNTFVYENSEGSLYYFDGEESCYIADRVTDYEIEQDNLAVQYIREADMEDGSYELSSYCFDSKQSKTLVAAMEDDENWCRNDGYIFYKEGENDSYDFLHDLYVNYEDGSTEYIDTDVGAFYRVYGREDAVYYLKLYNHDYNKYDLYFWEAGKGSKVVAKDIREQHVSFDKEKGIIFYTKDDGQVCYSIEGTEKYLDVLPGSNIFNHEVSPDGTRVVIGYFPGELFRESGTDLVCYRIEDGELVYEQKLSEHGHESCWLGDAYYFKEWDGTMENFVEGGGNLYCYRDGKVWNTGQEIADGMAILYQDGKAVSWSVMSYDLYFCEAGEDSVKVTDNADSHLYLGEDRLFFISDGDLYLYDGEGDAKLYAERVTKCYGVDIWYKTF